MPVASLLLASLPTHYNAVLAAASAVPVLLIWQSLLVGKTRKAAKVPYPYTSCSPQEVADDKTGAKHIFNCAQRAHLNTLENVTVFLFSLLYVGLEFPRVAAALGATWVTGRVLYTVGYTSGEPGKRMIGSQSSLALLGLVGMSIYVSVQQFL